MAASPATRLLAFLELLQDRPYATGAELAERLEVDVRTVRRYAVALQDLGIPVQGERGPGGGYRLRPGYKLPPLMLTDDEAAAVMLGLLAAQRLGLGSAAPAVDGARAKLRRVLPAALAARVSALEGALGFTAPADSSPPAGATILLIADAIARRRRVLARYTPWRGEPGSRELSPYGLVVHAGRWYLAAYDHGRDALRTFRADRLEDAALGGASEPPPDGFDPVAHVASSLARVPWTWDVEVLLETDLDSAAARIPPTLGELAAEDGGVRLRMRVESLDYMAGLLASLGWAFAIRRPDELRAHVRALARRLEAAAG